MARQKNDGRGRMGGRAKGTPNKTTAELKAWITQIIENGQDSFIERLENSDDRDYIKTYIGLLNYVHPKQAPTTPDDVWRKEKEMLQEMMLSKPDAMINRLAERLNNLIQKEDENKIR